MNLFFVYLIKSTISLALFYIVFKLAVSRDKMHSVNRFVLLGILITSAILPFAEIPVLQESSVIPQVEVFRQIMETPVFNNQQPVISEEIQSIQPTNTLSVNPVLLVYLFAIILLLFRLAISLVRVTQLIQKAEKQSFQNYMLEVVKDFIQPFSFLKNIVISEKDYTENREMVITHEYAHIKHFHAVDLVICELFTALHWFNPFVWLLRRDLKLIHEYQADQAVLNKGIDAAKYQLLVLEKAVGERRFAMANHFTQKPILKRIKMMKKRNLNRWNGFKLILFVPVALLILQAFSQPEIMNSGDIIVDQNKSTNNHSSIDSTEKYDVIIQNIRILVQNENCKLDELNEKIENILKKEKDKNNVSILAFDDVPPERIEKVKLEINNIPDIRISTTIVKLVETDVESISFKVLLKENGDIFLNDEKYFLPAFKDKISQLANNLETTKPNGYVFEIENNTTYLQVETVKDILRKANFVQVQQEIKHHSVSDLTPFADNTKPSTVVGLSISSPLTSQQLERLIASAKNYLKKPNTIEAIIYTTKETKASDTEILKKELLKAGFKKVTVETKS